MLFDRWYFIIPLLLLLSSCNDSTTPLIGQANSTSLKEFKGVNFVAPPRPFQADPIPELIEHNVSWIAVIPYAYTRLGKPSVRYNVSNYQWWGEKPEGAINTIQRAKQAGISVLLKPQVYIPGSWPGDLEFETEEDWQSWESDYQKYILEFATIADSMDVDLFCIGTEFKKSMLHRIDYWRSLVKKIRKVYRGKLVYSSNWDCYDKIQIWDEVDYVGINAYFPILEAVNPSVEELKKAWVRYEKEIANFYRKVKKPILFTEYGYLSVDGCSYQNWELEKRIDALSVNEDAQANALEALYQVFWNKPYWEGGFIWKWFPNMEGGEGYLDKDYTPQGKKGGVVLKRWYSN